MHKSKILIGGVALIPPLTGVGRYTYENAKRLQQYSDFTIWFDYGIHSQKILSNRSQKDTSSIIVKIKLLCLKFNFLKKVLRIIMEIASSLFSRKYDLYWQPSFIPSHFIKSKIIIVTIHDLSFLHYESWHPKERIKYFQKNFFKELEKIDYIITGSEFTKNELVKELGVKKEKISVIYHGVDTALYHPYSQQEIAPTMKKYNLPKNFILCVGSIEPRKNLLNLLKAYNLFSENLKKLFPLILVGFQGWQNNDILHEIAISKESIKYLGYLSDEELAHLYAGASLFVYPSLYEGFGLPPIEAMACGTPVVTSSISSLPEVCKDAVCYCNPYSPNDIADKMLKLINNEQMRNQLITLGLKQAQSYSWDRAAKEHYRLFKEILWDI